MNWLYLIPTYIVGYFIGSVNLSLIITKTVGKFDLRSKGSGNAGGTNVARTMGFKWGVLVILLEILKSTLFGLLAKFVFPADILGWGELGQCISGVVAVLGCLTGNMFPCFHGFKGGKGVTVGAAMLVTLQWWALPLAIVIFVLEFLCCRIVSVCSITAAIYAITVTLLVFGTEGNAWVLLCLVSVFALTVIWNHRANVKRLINGTENKMTFGKK